MNFPDFEFHIKGKRILKERKKAFYLSLLFPGLGQLYQRRWISGFAFLLIFLFPFYYLYLIGFKLNYGSVFLILSQFLLYILQLLDAKRGAKRETSPCEDFCPANVNIPTFMSYCESGDFKKAFGSFMTRAPFPFTLGEICPAQCETKCGILPERPLKIREVHREFGKKILEEIEIIEREPVFPIINKKVAVVGGGAAGLTVAYYLASAGIKVDIFEKENELGGLLHVIPDFKLNKVLLRKEIEFLTSFKNIKVFLNTKVNSRLKNYDFVVIATGAQKEKKLDIPTKGNPKILYPLSFLKNPPKLKGKKVVVIGAGDTAFDVARLTIKKEGEAFVFYRGDATEIKAQQREINVAIREGVKIYTNCQPVLVENKKVKFSCGEVSFDYLVPAIGFEKDKEIFKVFGVSGGKLFENGVFVVGDSLNGVSSVVNAVRDGRIAAYEILKKLGLWERAWFTVDFYHPKPERTSGENLFIISESSLCQHCGKKVES
ncbi:FAD-dependent oxidoreductase [Desulfurobacterium thermolithotrophum]|uniref:FAD-dependent oxidoreductase n=1 Tax=Desulfurobacterium thermolithotrophum TaxID=64160 RepID=UPI0013D6FE03